MRADEGSYNRACAPVWPAAVDEHQPVSGTRADRPPARPIGASRVLPRLPARPQLDDQLGQDLSRQSGHSAIGDSGGTSQAP
jgi:hypothetical protein